MSFNPLLTLPSSVKLYWLDVFPRRAFDNIWRDDKCHHLPCDLSTGRRGVGLSLCTTRLSLCLSGNLPHVCRSDQLCRGSKASGNKSFQSTKWISIIEFSRAVESWIKLAAVRVFDVRWSQLSNMKTSRQLSLMKGAEMSSVKIQIVQYLLFECQVSDYFITAKITAV